MIIKFDGQLEIDTDRGVIYFHDGWKGRTVLRICRLPAPIPTPIEFIDITHLHGCNYVPDEEEK